MCNKYSATQKRATLLKLSFKKVTLLGLIYIAGFFPNNLSSVIILRNWRSNCCQFVVKSVLSSPQTRINTGFIYPSSSSSGLARWQNTSDAVTIPRTSCSVTNCFFTTTVTFRQSRQTVCPQRVPLLFEGSRMTFDVLSILMVFCKCPSHTF